MEERYVHLRVRSLLLDRQETFATSSDLGFCPLVQHDINTGDARPIKQSPRRPPRETEDEILHEMLEAWLLSHPPRNGRPQSVW